MPTSTTVGQLMVNEALPPDMRDYTRVLDKKALGLLLRQLAQEHPEQYREVSQKLSQIGWHASFTSGGQSFGLRHLQASPTAAAKRAALREALNEIYSRDDKDDDWKDKQILVLVNQIASTQENELFDEQDTAGNPLADQVRSGSRGNKMNLASLLASDLLYTDHRGRVIPFPVLRSYAQGLSPAEYWAGAYGARKGVIDLKMATQDAGFLSKQLNQIVHRNLITGVDEDTSGQDPDKSRPVRGLPVDLDDVDNEGALLAVETGGYPRNQTLTPKVVEDLRRRGIKRILIRSPVVGGAPDGGLYARDVGVREFGTLPVRGENVSLAAVQALSEPLTQAQISSKHTGGVAGAGAARAIGGFDYINQLIQVPKVFKGGAAHSEQDGTVQAIEEAPAGGYYVSIGGQKHYVGAGYDLKVKQGDKVEAGDVLSEGTPNPATIVKYKGIGEGRRYFIKAFREAYQDADLPVHRRNVELLAKGLINHVRLTDEAGDHNPDDVIPYSRLEHTYQPREDAMQLSPKAAIGQHLETPVLHYSIGTRIRPSVVKDLEEFGINQIQVHRDPPPFEAEMIRGMTNLQHDPDWLTRMYGSGLKKSLLGATHRGGASNPTGTSFVPGLAKSVDFGRTGQVITPQRETPSPKLAELRERVRMYKEAKHKVTLAELRERVRQHREKKSAYVMRPKAPSFSNVPMEERFQWKPEHFAAAEADPRIALSQLASARRREAQAWNKYWQGRWGRQEQLKNRPWYHPGKILDTARAWTGLDTNMPIPPAVTGMKSLPPGGIGVPELHWTEAMPVGTAMMQALPRNESGGRIIPQQDLLQGQMERLAPVPGEEVPWELSGDPGNYGVAFGPKMMSLGVTDPGEIKARLLPDPGEEWRYPEGLTTPEQQQAFRESFGGMSPRDVVGYYNNQILSGRVPNAEYASRIMAMYYPEQYQAAFDARNFGIPGAAPAKPQSEPLQYEPVNPAQDWAQASGEALPTGQQPQTPQVQAPQQPASVPPAQAGGALPQRVPPAQPAQPPVGQQPAPPQPAPQRAQPGRSLPKGSPFFSMFQAAPQQVGSYFSALGPAGLAMMSSLGDFQTLTAGPGPGKSAPQQTALRPSPPVASGIKPNLKPVGPTLRMPSPQAAMI